MNAIYRAFLSSSNLYRTYSFLQKQSYFISQFKDQPYGFSNIFPRESMIQMDFSFVKQFNDLLSQYTNGHSNAQKSQNIQKMIKKMESRGHNREEVHLFLATCLFLQRKYQAAIREYNKASKICNKNTPDYSIKISICLIQSQNYFDAIKLLQNESSKHPNNPILYHLLAIAYSMVQNYQEIVFNFYKSYQLGGELQEKFVEKGRELLLEERYREALPFCIKWVIHKKDDEVALEGLKCCFINAEKIEEGKQFYSYLGQIQEYYLAVQHSLGLFYFQTGKIKEAKSHLLKAAKLKADNFQLNLYLGTVYIQQDQNEDAIACLERCLTIRPDDSTVLSTLALVYMKLNQIQKAFSLALRSTECNGGDSMSWYGLGIIYLHKNEVQNGIKSLRKAIELDEYNYPALQKLGNTLYLLGDEKEAAILLKRSEKAKEKLTES